MPFLRKYQYAAQEQIVTVIIDNSDVISVGDPCQLRNGNIEDAVVGAAIAGVIVDIVDANGNSVFGSLAVLGSATVSGSPSSGTCTVASNNETVDLIAAKIDLSKASIYSAPVTGTMNTTTASNKIGGWVNLASGGQNVDETTHSRTITDVRQLKNWGVDPDDSTRMLVSINHSEMWDNGAAMA